jgi:hypothetical protein
MCLSSNKTLFSFLLAQVYNPNQKSGANTVLSLFVQLFASSEPGYHGSAKLGSLRPIVPSQYMLDSLVTHVLFEQSKQAQQACANGGSSVLMLIFQFAFDMIECVQTLCRDQQGDVTSSEQNLDYALTALMKISYSFKYCIENNIAGNPYTSAQPCVNCELNLLTSELFRKLPPLKKVMSKLQMQEKFGARISHLISDWWYRMERRFLCKCSLAKVVGNEQLKVVKKIASPRYFNLEGTPRMMPSLQVALSVISSSVPSPNDSPKSCGSPQAAPPRSIFPIPPLELAAEASPSANRTPSDPNTPSLRHSRTHVVAYSERKSKTLKPLLTEETRFQTILKQLRDHQGDGSGL